MQVIPKSFILSLPPHSTALISPFFSLLPHNKKILKRSSCSDPWLENAGMDIVCQVLPIPWEHALAHVAPWCHHTMTEERINKNVSSSLIYAIEFFFAYSHGDLAKANMSSGLTHGALLQEIQFYHHLPIFSPSPVITPRPPHSEQMLPVCIYHTAGSFWALPKFRRWSLRLWGILYINRHMYEWQKTLSSVELLPY